MAVQPFERMVPVARSPYSFLNRRGKLDDGATFPTSILTGNSSSEQWRGR